MRVGHLIQEVLPQLVSVVFMTTYLLALDKQYDEQASELRKCIHRAVEAEIIVRKLHVQLAEAQAQAAAAEGRETAIAEVLKVAKDRHAQKLKDTYLITRIKRRMLAEGDQEPIVLKTKIKMDIEGPSAPPPTETSHEALELEHRKEEGFPLLTQPPPKEDGDPPLSPKEEPQMREA